MLLWRWKHGKSRIFRHKSLWMQFNIFFEMLNSTLLWMNKNVSVMSVFVLIILEALGSDWCHLGKWVLPQECLKFSFHKESQIFHKDFFRQGLHACMSLCDSSSNQSVAVWDCQKKYLATLCTDDGIHLNNRTSGYR